MKEVFVTGYAKFPKNITGKEFYNDLGIGLIIDRENGEIKDADCTLVTRTGKKFVLEILRGESLLDIDLLVNKVENNYYGQAQNAIIAALKLACQKYHCILQKNNKTI